MTKKCWKCGEVKDFSEYYKNKYKNDGIHDSCKECNRKRFKKYYLEHRQKYLDYDKYWRANNPEKYQEKLRRQRKEV